MTRGSGTRPMVLVSACLLGQRVRYDGREKRDGSIADGLADTFQLLPVCPETGIGLGVPRPPIRLVREKGGIRCVAAAGGGDDFTADLGVFADTLLNGPAFPHGCILKSRSPSCGIRDTPLFDSRGAELRPAAGIFAHRLMRRRRWLPMEDENGLRDPARRESFLWRVLACKRWFDGVEPGADAEAARIFHRDHELLLRAYRADAGGQPGRPAYASSGQAYLEWFMTVLARPTTRGGHANALRYALDLLGRHLETAEQAAMDHAIEEYLGGAVSLHGVMARLRGMARQDPGEWLRRQVYLYPPAERLLLG